MRCTQGENLEDAGERLVFWISDEAIWDRRLRKLGSLPRRGSSSAGELPALPALLADLEQHLLDGPVHLANPERATRRRLAETVYTTPALREHTADPGP